MELTTTQIPLQLQQSLWAYAKSHNANYDDLLREAVVDFLLKDASENQLSYDDDDAQLRKNAQISASFSLMEEAEDYNG